MDNRSPHPLQLFKYCPVCGQEGFEVRNEKSKSCAACGFIYYINPSAATACFVYDAEGMLLVVRRAHEPAKGTLDLPGGFMDLAETAEDCIIRELHEETGLKLPEVKYLFSLPNKYLYSGLIVPTADLFFEARTQSFSAAKADDDAEELLYKDPSDLCAEDFGLESIRRAVSLKHPEMPLKRSAER